MIKFNETYLSLLKEAELPNNSSHSDGMGQAPAPNDKNAGGSESADEEQKEDEGLEDLEDINEEPISPEEIELAKLAVRALYFNVDSKDVHQFTLKVDEDRIPFEKITDYFEATKRWKPVIAFVEYVMDKFEGFSSKWTEQPEIKGKNIFDKIKYFNKKNPDQQLDNGKRLYWVRLILNCLLHGKPTENLTIADVNEQNINEIFDMLKMHYGTDTRGIMPGKDVRSPGNF
jgi:hypothetical protein